MMQESINNAMRQYLLSKRQNMTYGDILNANDPDTSQNNFYTEEERKMRDAVIESDRQRLLRFQ